MTPKTGIAIKTESEMKPIDPLQLQRLVDSELDDKQIHQILADANATPEHWQEIAIGFIENQSWSRAFRNQETKHNTGQDSVVLVSDPGRVKSESKRSPMRYSSFVLTASLLAAATMGYMTSQIQNRNLPVALDEGHELPATGPMLVDGSSTKAQPKQGYIVDQPRMTQADYHLEVPAEQLGEMASVGPVAPVPLFSVDNVEQLNQLSQQPVTPAISPLMLERLAGSGYQMEQDINYICGRLGDGRSFVVPVRTIRFLQGQ